MVKSAYQAQAIPEPDANGRLVLKETNTNILGMVLIIFCICVFALMSAAYWYLLVCSSSLTAGLSVVQIKLAAALGIASPLALPYCIKWLRNPPSLIIDNEGVELRKPGQTQRMAWRDIQEIKTGVIRDTRTFPLNGTGTFDPYAVTMIKGQSEGIFLNTDFGLPATTLAAYLIQRQHSISSSGTKLPDMNAASTQNFETRTRLLHQFQLVVFLVLIAGVIAFLGFLLWARMTLF